jgi:hypothetical protein
MIQDLKKIEADVEAISKRAREAFFSESSFEKAMTVARSIEELRQAVTPMMPDIMKLMNTSLGFRTDQDPNFPSASNPKPEPYKMEVVREAFIEATLRGFYPVNNEFNIIAGRFYGAKNGFERLVKKHENVANYKEVFGTPVAVSETGAKITCKATWKQKAGGKYIPQELEREFPVRINRGMGADAIIGKAQRKFYAAILSMLTGVITPDGDATDLADLKTAGPEKTAKDLFEKGDKK